MSVCRNTFRVCMHAWVLCICVRMFMNKYLCACKEANMGAQLHNLFISINSSIVFNYACAFDSKKHIFVYICMYYVCCDHLSTVIIWQRVSIMIFYECVSKSKTIASERLKNIICTKNKLFFFFWEFAKRAKDLNLY